MNFLYMSCILTTVYTLKLNIIFKTFNNLIEPNTEYFSFLDPLNEVFTEGESYKDGCISFWKRDYSEEQHLIFDSRYRKSCFLIDEMKNDRLISIGSQNICGLMGTLDKVGLVITPYFKTMQSYIIIEGCYFYTKTNEKEDVIWTMTNNSINKHDPIRNYLNNVTTRFQIKNGEIFYGDGSNQCSRLCVKVSRNATIVEYEDEDISQKRTVGGGDGDSKSTSDINVVMLLVFILIGLILVSILGYRIYKMNALDKIFNGNY